MHIGKNYKSHYPLPSGENKISSRGVASVARDADIPVMFGVLTTDNLEQAEDRSGGKCGNKGAETALAAIEMATLFKKL